MHKNLFLSSYFYLIIYLLRLRPFHYSSIYHLGFSENNIRINVSHVSLTLFHISIAFIGN